MSPRRYLFFAILAGFVQAIYKLQNRRLILSQCISSQCFICRTLSIPRSVMLIVLDSSDVSMRPSSLRTSAISFDASVPSPQPLTQDHSIHLSNLPQYLDLPLSFQKVCLYLPSSSLVKTVGIKNSDQVWRKL